VESLPGFLLQLQERSVCGPLFECSAFAFATLLLSLPVFASQKRPTCNSKYFNNRKGKPVMNNLKKFTSASFLMLAVLWLTASFHPASAQSIPPLGAASSFAVLGGMQ